MKISIQSAVFSLVTALIFFSCVCGDAFSQDQKPASDALANQQAAETIKHELEGSFECANCHVAPRIGDKRRRVTDFVMLNEFQIWLNDDPHARGYLSIIPNEENFRAVAKRLDQLRGDVESDSDEEVGAMTVPVWGESNIRSQQILQKMFGAEYQTSIDQLFNDITKVLNSSDRPLRKTELNPFMPRLTETLQQCLSCHAGWDKRQFEFDIDIVQYGTGVSCESCHGAASDWWRVHDDPKWREMDPREKFSEYGMIDVRNPVTRTEQCYSCHIGNVAQGKVVTHEMYAAGHPPLPGIEVESFADQIPRHWRYLSEKKKGFEFRGEFEKHYGYDAKQKKSMAWTEDEFPRTKNLLVGGIMASAHSIDLLAESAGEFVKLQNSAGGANAKLGQSGWPEFAAFDCAACHHDLKANNWDRGFAGVPGRPPAQYWPRPLARLGVAYLDTQKGTHHFETYKDQQHQLQAVLDRQPFGKPDELALQGSKFADWLSRDVANEIQSQPLTSDDAVGVLQLLCGATQNAAFSPDEEAWDFHSARQLAWAIDLVYAELNQTRHTGERQLNRPDDANSSFGVVMAEMKKSLLLDLPTTGTITVQQDQFLSTWRDFDRKKFLDQLNQLKQAASTVAVRPPVKP